MRRPQTKIKVATMDSVAVKEDTALGITWQVGIDEQKQLVIQTYIQRDCPKDELDKLLKKCTDASDTIAKIYRLRLLRMELKKFESELGRTMEMHRVLNDQYRAEHAESGRRGPWEAKGQQVTALGTNINAQENLKRQISFTKTEIQLLDEAY